MSERDRNSNFLTELSRRRVLRSAAAYVVVAWVVVQVGSIVFPEFGAPDWAMRALIIVFVVGFPPAMLLAWTVDLSTQGFVRTPDSGYLRAHGRWPRVLTLFIATAMSTGMLWLTWDDYIVQTGQRLERTAIKSQPVIAVNSPRQRVGEPENAWLGDGIANLIRGELAESQHAIVISQSRWNALTIEITSTESLSTMAREIGVDYLVDGEYIETPDGFVLTMHIEDLESRTEIHSSRMNLPDAAAAIASVPEYSTRIKQALRIPHTESVGTFEADFATENISAYEAYIAGLSYWGKSSLQNAESAFKAALASAPDYHVARLRLAQLYEEAGRTALAWSTLNEISLGPDVSQRLKLYIEGAKAYFVEERDPKKAVEAYKRLVELYPYEFEARLYLVDSYWLSFQDAEAIVEARRLTELHAYDPNSWAALGRRLLEFGDLDAAKFALEKYVSMHPDVANAHAMLGQLAQLQGDLAASAEFHQQALDLSPGLASSTIGLAGTRYLQGEVNSALELWYSVVSGPEVSTTNRIDAAFEMAGVLRGLGRFDESLTLLADTMPAFEEEGRRAAMAVSQEASTYFELGDHERANAHFVESIRIARPPVTRYLFAHGMAELRRKRFDVVAGIVEEIITNATGSAGTREDAVGASNYLNGLVALEQDDLTTAEEYLTAAIEGIGYRYAVYDLGLARLLRATGDLERARIMAESAVLHQDSGEYQSSGNLRLDLELDRARARLLLAEILAEQGLQGEARVRAVEFLQWWKDAPPELPEIVRARKIIANATEQASQ